MGRRESTRRSTYRFAMRLDFELDSDLIEWMEAQPHGKRSEAVRDLMRDGLRMRQVEGNLAAMVRQAVADALAGVQVVSSQPGTSAGSDEAEEAFGDQLDALLGQFG